MNNVIFSHKTDNWNTPKQLYDNLNLEYKFTLDPCCDFDNHLCDKYYTKKENGLLQTWINETVFCNPPYSDIKSWVAKAVYEYSEHLTLTVLLLPARTDTKWFHDYLYNKPYCKIIFLKGRLKFSNSKNSAPFPSMICIIGDKIS